MAVDPLITVAAFSFATAGVYAFVGGRVAPKGVRSEASVARALFTAWWIALATTTALSGLIAIAAAAGKLTLVTMVLLTHINLLLICIALWGLLYYLVYIFSGRAGLLAPITVAYLALYLYFVYFITSNRPIGISVDRWTVQLQYERTVPAQGAFVIFLVALLILPQILGSIALLWLVMRGGERSQRYRVALVSAAILVWFGSAFVAAVIGVGQNEVWQISSRVISLVAAFLVLAAYRPPSWVRRRFGIEPIPET